MQAPLCKEPWQKGSENAWEGVLLEKGHVHFPVCWVNVVPGTSRGVSLMWQHSLLLLYKNSFLYSIEQLHRIKPLYASLCLGPNHGKSENLTNQLPVKHLPHTAVNTGTYYQSVKIFSAS